VLLAGVLNLHSGAVIARYNDDLNEAQASSFFELWEKRLAGYPIAYLTGSKEFFGRDFLVDPRVLIPRPDTEIIIEKVLQDFPPPSIEILDCCTGSGCIALTLAAERPEWRITATDISFDALEVAKENERRILGSQQVEWIQTDLMEGVTQKFNAIVANPPYLTETECKIRAQRGWVEPEIALISGADGLDHIRALVNQARSLLLPGGGLYIESGPDQIEKIQALLKGAHFADIHSTADLTGRFRITQGTK